MYKKIKVHISELKDVENILFLKVIITRKNVML